MQNICVIAGRVAIDVESKVTPNGKNFVKTRIACRRDYSTGQTDEQGRKQYETDWINAVCWGKTAEYFGQKVKKGDLIEIVGRLQSNEYNDQQSGQKRTSHEINFDRFYILESKGDGQPQQANFNQAQQQQSAQQPFGGQQNSFGNQQPFGTQQNGFGNQQPVQSNNSGFSQPTNFQQSSNGFNNPQNFGGNQPNAGFNNPQNFGGQSNGFSQPTNFQR